MINILCRPRNKLLVQILFALFFDSFMIDFSALYSHLGNFSDIPLKIKYEIYITEKWKETDSVFEN